MLAAMFTDLRASTGRPVSFSGTERTVEQVGLSCLQASNDFGLSYGLSIGIKVDHLYTEFGKGKTPINLLR